MKFSKTTLSLLASLLISVFASIFVAFIPDTSPFLVLVVAFVIATVSFFIFYLIFEYWVEKQILKILNKVNNLSDNSWHISEKRILKSDNPIKKLDDNLKQILDKHKDEIKSMKDLESYRKEFIANISHELKTPIFTVQGYIETLLGGAHKDPVLSVDFLQKASNSIDKLESLVSDILAISKSESGDFKPQLQWIYAPKVIDEAIESVSKIAEKKNISIDFKEINGSFSWVWADESSLFQVMKNLLENAVRYSFDNQKVKVVLRKKGDNLEFSVSDQGPGISLKEQERIFERFYTIDKSRSRSTGGSGLGLSIVKHLLLLHNSQIKLKSIEGKGSKFYFSLKSKKINTL
jgi:two-component system phosphate regulon sensor histidine kinase PhoR